MKTKSGNYIVLEYKGEHLVGSEDSDYKKAIGAMWQKLSDKGVDVKVRHNNYARYFLIERKGEGSGRSSAEVARVGQPVIIMV